jgi:HlyD family secretion protein
VRLQPVVEQNVVSYVTVIDVPNTDLKLKPGMTAAVTIETARADDAIKVPNAALRFRPTEEAFEALGQKAPEQRQRAQGETAQRPRGDGATPPRTDRAAVWVLAQGALTRVSVQPGISDGTQTVVVSNDLAPGARVVTGTSTPAITAAAPTSSPLIPAGRRGAGGGRR